jgi:antitoxin (DNA-binding transcriptional repressor) of toxin-antitoxin stability system
MPETDYLAQIIQRAKRGDVFSIDQGDKPVAIVLPARYIDTLTENFDKWNFDGRLVLPEEGHGWRRVKNFLRPKKPARDPKEAQPL